MNFIVYTSEKADFIFKMDTEKLTSSSLEEMIQLCYYSEFSFLQNKERIFQKYTGNEKQ